MTVYIVAAVVVVLFLYGAYRLMGAGADVEEDPKAVLFAVLDTASTAAKDLDAIRTATDSAAAHTLRRTLDGCAQALERIAAIPVEVSLDQARTALELGVDELTWFARLAELPAYARDDALRDAGAGLWTRGSANLERARSVLGR